MFQQRAANWKSLQAIAAAFFHSHGDARRYDGPVCPRFGKLSGTLVGGVVL